MGRETGIEKCVWSDDGWLYLENGGLLPRVEVPSPSGATRQDLRERLYHFADGLPDDFQWLRTPYPDRIFRTSNDGLVLIGRESIGSWFEQALVARRQEDADYDAETTVGFEPVTYQQAAGLTTYYNRHKHHVAMLTHAAGQGRILTVMSCIGTDDTANVTFPGAVAVKVPDGPIRLKVETRHATQQFYWAEPGNPWQALGPKLDASQISDEGGRGEHASFTGAFVGMVAMDLTGQGREALFADFAYRPL
jgi:xylan 1,4-beta-xylosidase